MATMDCDNACPIFHIRGNSTLKHYDNRPGDRKSVLPVHAFNFIYGGSHAGNEVAMQINDGSQNISGDALTDDFNPTNSQHHGDAPVDEDGTEQTHNTILPPKELKLTWNSNILPVMPDHGDTVSSVLTGQSSKPMEINDDGSQNISGDALTDDPNPNDFGWIYDLVDEDDTEQTHNTILPPKELKLTSNSNSLPVIPDHGDTVGSVLTWQSSKTMEINDDGSLNISGEALTDKLNPVEFGWVYDLVDEDDTEQTHNTLIPSRELKLTSNSNNLQVIPDPEETVWSDLTGKSSKPVEVDPYDVLASKLLHSGIFNFDLVGFSESMSFIAARELIRIAHEHHCEPFFAVMERSSGRIYTSITFTDEDMVVPKEHNFPLYFPFKINGVSFRRAMMDNGATINLMPLSTFKVARIPDKRLVKETCGITGVFGQGNTLGHVMVNLEIGEISSETLFHVVNTHSVCHVLLGRPWIHKHEGIPSTLHQCFKGKFNGREVVIKASQTPFEGDEIHLPNAFLYKESAPEELEPQPI